jgi:hypothetical protein
MTVDAACRDVAKISPVGFYALRNIYDKHRKHAQLIVSDPADIKDFEIEYQDPP